MNGRNAQRDAILMTIREVEQTLLQRGFIEVSPFVARINFCLTHAGMAAQFVELFETALADEIVNDEAALTAKMFFILRGGKIQTRFTAMKAGGLHARPRRRLIQRQSAGSRDDVVQGATHFDK